MRLLGLISWPYFRKHVLRTLLTTAGIVLGVSVFVGMHTANQSVLGAFSQTVDRIAGKTQLQITAGEAGFEEAVLEKVQSALTVRVAVPVIEAVVDTNIAGRGSLLVLGVDLTGDRSLRDYALDSADESIVDDPLVFLAQADSLIVSKDFADAAALTVESRLPLRTMEGERRFTIRGVMKPSGLTSVFGGNLAIMDVYAAQKMFGRGRSFDRIDLAVAPNRTIAECQAELRALLGPGFQIEPPSGRGQQFEATLAAYSMMVGISSLFALFIGMFIIYNSFAIAVTQRRSEIGILRALGATRGQIRWLFLGESAVTGVVGSLVGLGFGVLIARVVSLSVASLISDVYGVAQQPDDPATNPTILALAMVVGVVTSVLAAAVPAQAAAALDPVHALQKGKYQVLSAGEHRVRVIVAGLLGAASIGCLVAPGLFWTSAASPRAVFYAGYAFTVIVAVLLSPLLSLALARAIRPLLRWIRPVEGALAADSLIQSPRRTSACVAALMLSLALVVAFGGMSRASYDSIIGWMNVTLNPDLFVLPSASVVERKVRFPKAMAAELAAISGISRVQMVRSARVTFRQTPVMAVAVEIESIAQTSKLAPVQGESVDMYRRTAAGTGLMVSDNLAQLQGLSLGDVLEIPAPAGVIALPIVGVIVDYSDQQGAIFMDRSVFERYWHDDSVNIFRVFVTPGANIAEVRQRVLERYAGTRQVFVLVNDEIKAYILKVTDQWFALTSVQIAVAVLVAILGIVNTLTVSITDRRRELGVLQAVGGLHGQIRRTIWIEALSIGCIGLVLGFSLGAVNLYYILQVVHNDIVGMRIDYHFPVALALALVPMILGAAFVAAIGPAESAVRGSLVEALEYE